MQKISTQELKKRLGEDQKMLLLNVLSEPEFKKQRIAGSINVPLRGNRYFIEDVKRQVDGDQPIVVHCSGEDCPLSREAAKKLHEEGFHGVFHYQDGTQGWFGQEEERH